MRIVVGIGGVRIHPVKVLVLLSLGLGLCLSLCMLVICLVSMLLLMALLVMYPRRVGLRVLMLMGKDMI